MYDSSPTRKAQYAPARKTLTVFAVITIICLIMTIVIAVWCALNYNKGLKPHILRRSRSSSVGTDGGSYEGKESQYPLDPYGAPGSGGSGGPSAGRTNGGSRMEID
jgi:amino acid transporter